MITEEQVKILKDSIDEMSRSDEQFVLIFYKNSKDIDRSVGYCHNMPVDKLMSFLTQELVRINIRGEDEYSG